MKRSYSGNRDLAGLEEQASSPQIRELEGLTQLGMKNEALTMSFCLLSEEPAKAETFAAALDAILSHVTQMKPWKKLVENAYRRLSKTGKKKVRFLMLSFECGLGNYRVAVDFLPKHFSGKMALVELLFAMETMLALDRMDEARKIARKCLHGIERAENLEMRQLFNLALAAYLARVKRWNAAVVLWEELLRSDIGAENAIYGLVNIGLAHSLDAVTQGLAAIQSRKKHLSPAITFVTPDEERHRWDEIEDFLIKRKKLLGRLLPKKTRKEYGIA
jgi:hypothetical protein